MSIIDLSCRESVCAFQKGCYSCGCTDTLLLGGGYQIYLFFELLPYEYLKYLKEAKLVLFKIPFPVILSQATQEERYEIYPLFDYFSAYGCYYDPPPADYSRKESFVNRECCSYSEADITSIVKAWLNEEVENKGLLLTGARKARPIAYASYRYERKGMRPMLRLKYEDHGICPPLTTVPCTVQIDE